MKLKIFFFFLIVACFSSGIIAQEKPELFSKIERVFKEKEPAWKVEKNYPSSTSDPIKQDIVFRSGKDQASIQITIWKREQDAKDVFTSESNGFNNTMGRRMIKNNLPGLGDENHIWTNRGSEAWPMLNFRKGNIDVTVFAPSVTVAKRFAQHVLEQITAG
jgi:hypothetical protein